MMAQVFPRILQPGGRLFERIWHRDGQLTAGVALTEENFSNGAPHPLSGEEGFQQRPAFAKPWHHHRIAVGQHHHHVRLYRSDLADQLFVRGENIQILAIAIFAIFANRRADKNHCHVGGPGNIARLRQSLLVALVVVWRARRPRDLKVVPGKIENLIQRTVEQIRNRGGTT